MENDPNQKRDSLFQDHLRILGIEQESSELTPFQVEERARIEALSLKPLSLPIKKSWLEKLSNMISSPSLGGGVLALALSVTFVVVLNNQKRDVLQVKGSHRVSFVWERGGVVSPLKEGIHLQDGDKIGASVISSEKATAFWMVTDDAYNILSNLDDIWAGRLDLSPGINKAFSSSFTLVAPNEGEFLVVAICPQSNATDKEGGIKQIHSLGPEMLSKVTSEGSLDAMGCQLIGRGLRKRGQDDVAK